MKRAQAMSLLFLLLVSNVTYAQKPPRTTSAGGWASFYSAFRAAVHKRDHDAMRKLMSPKVQTSEGDKSPDEAFRDLDNAGGELWKDMEKSLATGSKSYKGSNARSPTRVTNDNALVFELSKDGKWRWIGFMGD